MRGCHCLVLALSASFLATSDAGVAPAQSVDKPEWAKVTEDDRAIKIETDKLENSLRQTLMGQDLTCIRLGKVAPNPDGSMPARTRSPSETTDKGS